VGGRILQLNIVRGKQDAVGKLQPDQGAGRQQVGWGGVPCRPHREPTLRWSHSAPSEQQRPFAAAWSDTPARRPP